MLNRRGFLGRAGAVVAAALLPFGLLPKRTPGISERFISTYDVERFQHITRIDLVYGLQTMETKYVPIRITEC